MPDKPKRTPPEGRVITFYSYKGGTGRSMAAANVAWLLAMNGKRVLVVDWDLEAPGIHRYFHPLLEDKELLETEGLLDFVEKLQTRAAVSKEPLTEKDVDVIEYIKILEWPPNFPISWPRFGPNAGIDLLVAGRQGPLYGQRLNAFSFADFYEKLGGRRLLAMAREQMRGIYDYVLIDSRTGVSDTSGICTVEMPETLVVCFTLNDQSIVGASGVAHDVSEKHKQFLAQRAAAIAPPADKITPPPFRIFPVPTRVEINGESGKRQIALDLARRKFAPFLEEHIERSQWSLYWGSVQMAYFASYAFEEIPAVFNDPVHDRISLLAAMKEVARWITGDRALEMPPLASDEERTESLRRDILGWYLRKTDADTADPVAMAQAALDQAGDPVMVRRALLRLVKPGGDTPIATIGEIADFDGEQQPLVRTLADAGILAITGTSVSIADRNVVEKWDRLAQWVRQDEEFLKWRQPFIVAARQWRDSNKEKSQLLRGKSYQQARDWLKQRPADFNSTEQAFVNDSRINYRRNIVIGAPLLIAMLIFGIWGSYKVYQDLRRYFAPAGEFWTIKTPVTGSTLLSITGSGDGKKLWASSTSGEILTSTDGGAQWTGRDTGANSRLTSVFATRDGTQAWAVGSNTLTKYVDPGAHWTTVASYQFSSISGTGDGHRLWAVGPRGAILQSGDGGSHWANANSGTTADLESVFVTSDGNRLWAVGAAGTILQSTDAGAHWATAGSGTGNLLYSVSGTPAGTHLWAVGKGGIILQSSDGGLHWAKSDSGTSADLTSVFADGKRVLVVGHAGTILQSMDGERWIQRTSGTSASLYSVFGTEDGKRFWAVGERGVLLESNGR